MLVKLFGFFLFFLAGCQTSFLERGANLSQKEKDFFSASGETGGFSFSRLLVDGKPRYKGDLEWSLAGSESFLLSILDPFGSTLLSVEGLSEGLLVRGKGSEEIARYSGDQEGFLLVRGHQLGVKISEIRSFLQRKLHPDWLELSAFSDISDRRFYFEDKKRKIQVDFSYDKNNELEEVCAILSWSTFWIFKSSSVKMCFNEGEPKSSFLNFDDKLELKIQEIY